MKNNLKKTIYCLLLVAASINAKNGNFADVGRNAGKGLAKEIAKAIPQKPERTDLANKGIAISQNFGQNAGQAAATVLAPALIEFAQNSDNIGENAGQKVGLVTVTYVVGEAKVAIAYVIKFGNAYVIPALPYLAGGAAIIGTGFVAHYTYRCFYPTPETIEKNENHLAQAAKYKAKRETIEKTDVFHKCLSANELAEKHSSGVPLPCRESAARLAALVGKDKILETVDNYNAFAL